MNDSMTIRHWLLLALGLAAILLGIAVTSGTFGGPSDIDSRIRASEPTERVSYEG
jgi:hypothetical protein